MSWNPKKVVLLILDGWGLGPKDKFNAVDNAKKPNFDKLVRDYPNISLRSDGKFVGLPDGQYGTSEINHQVIGAGRVFLQDLPKIDKSIEDKSFFGNKALIKSFEHVIKNNSKLHLVGIVSDGKVHSSVNHILALLDMAKEQKIDEVYVHAFTDGRDTPPRSAQWYLEVVDKKLEEFKIGKIATIQGRFWLDRDRDWDKTEVALDLLTKGKGGNFNDWSSVINQNYNQNITDEFIGQYLIDENGLIGNNDSVIFFHYRTDRLYQIVHKIIESKLENLSVTTFIEVSESLKTEVAFPRPVINQTLAETIAQSGKSQLHITETEKFNHLTYFLNGGRETEFEKEEWIRLQSNRMIKPFYNLEPNMQAFKITQEVISRIDKDNNDLIIVNFANTDMVGHTGNYEAAVVACESVDFCIGEIYEKIKEKLSDYALIVTADHGNSDEMWDYKNNQPHTQHTTNPVPFILVSDINCRLARRESLEDIAPTVLELMGIEKPKVMTGESLVIESTV